MRIGQYELLSEEKLNRVLKGQLGRLGQLTGGLENSPGWAEKSEEEKNALILAEYDKTGGLIMKGTLKVATGSFWDVVNKKPRVEPNLKFVTSIEDEMIEVTEEEAKVIEENKSKISSIKKKKKKARL